MARRGDWYGDSTPNFGAQRYGGYQPQPEFGITTPSHNHNHGMPYSAYTSGPPRPPQVQQHACQGCSDLRNNMEFVEAQNRRMQEENQRLIGDMDSLKHKMTQPDPEAMREMQRLRDDTNDRMKQYLQEKESKESVEHQYNQCKLELQNDKTSFELAKKSWTLAENNLKKQAELEREQAKEKLEHERNQKQREVDTLRKDKEQATKDGDKQVSQLEETISKLRKQQDDDRTALHEAQAIKSKLDKTIDAFKEDGRRKDELNSLLQKENETKQDRVDEALKLVSTLQSKNNELEMNANDYIVELARTHEAVESLKKTKAGLEDQNKAETKDVDKWRSAYTEICGIIGANGVEIRGVQANSVASSLVQEVSQLKHDLVKKELEITEEKNEVELQKMKVAEVERERNDVQESLHNKEDQCIQLEEELYTTMQELREFMAKCGAQDVTAVTIEKRNKDATEAIEKKDKEIARLYDELKCKEGALTTTSTKWLDERTTLEELAKQELTVLNFDHNQQIQRLEKEIHEADELAKQQGEFADMCESLGKLLEVGKGYSLTAAHKARQIYETVETLLDENDSLKKTTEDLENQKQQLNEQAIDLQLQIEEAIEHHRQTETERDDVQTKALDNPWDTGVNSRRLVVSHKLNDSTQSQRTGAEQRLREETRVLRSRMAKINLQHHEFVRNIAHALGIKQDPGDVVNLEVFTQQVKDLMEERGPAGYQHAHAHAPSHGGHRHTKKHPSGLGKSKQRYDHDNDHDRDHKNDSTTGHRLELVQQKYRTALRTIQTYDKILADIKTHHSHDAPSHELAAEINELKEQLYSTTGGGGGGMLDVGTDKMDDMREELKKYAQFYDELCKVLQYRRNPSFAEVVDKVRNLSGNATPGPRFNMSQSEPKYHLSSQMNASTSSKVYTPHRPMGSKSTHIHRRDVPTPWK